MFPTLYSLLAECRQCNSFSDVYKIGLFFHLFFSPGNTVNAVRLCSRSSAETQYVVLSHSRALYPDAEKSVVRMLSDCLNYYCFRAHDVVSNICSTLRHKACLIFAAEHFATQTFISQTRAAALSKVGLYQRLTPTFCPPSPKFYRGENAIF